MQLTTDTNNPIIKSQKYWRVQTTKTASAPQQIKANSPLLLKDEPLYDYYINALDVSKVLNKKNKVFK